MFTGLIEEIGCVARVGQSRGAKRVHVAAAAILNGLKIDDSVAVNGVCLTAIQVTAKEFAVEVVEETLRRTTLAELRVGDRVNLERALRADSRIGGHFVQGHIDGTSRISRLVNEAGGKRISIAVPQALAAYVVPKGSIAIDGVSLTVAALRNNELEIALIPHTLEVTTLGRRQVGDRVNIEVDILGKYVLQYLRPYLANKDLLANALNLKAED